jgi:hypothetical protein
LRQHGHEALPERKVTAPAKYVKSTMSEIDLVAQYDSVVNMIPQCLLMLK